MNSISGLYQLFSKLPKPYQLSVSQDYTSEMDELRSSVFPESNHEGRNEDRYDNRAWHITISHSGKLVAYCRIIPCPDAYFFNLTGSPLIINDTTSADWSRLVVVSTHRNRGLPVVIGFASLLLAEALGKCYVYAATEPSRKTVGLIEALGYQAVGKPIAIISTTVYSFDPQIFVCDLNHTTNAIHAKFIEASKSLLLNYV